MLFDVLFTEVSTLIEGRPQTVSIGVCDGRIVALNPNAPRAKVTHSLKNLFTLPGVIDSQVHFREPGLEHKEDFFSGTRAALKGGVTAVYDMPNTQPPTITIDAFQKKQSCIKGRAWCHFGLFGGARPDHLHELADLEKQPHCVGIKIFMGKSTGGLIVPPESLRKALQNTKRRVAVHSEDNALLEERFKEMSSSGLMTSVLEHPNWRNVEVAMRSTKHLIEAAFSNPPYHPVHILHVTTSEEISLLKQQRTKLPKQMVRGLSALTVEVTPQHLALSHPECYERLGTLVQMNPPIREKSHQNALWAGLQEGVVDVIGSDHAPHTLEEKQRPYPESPAGMPGVQTLLPLLLNWVHEKRLSLADVVRLVCYNPARLYGWTNKGEIAVGKDADFTCIDLKKWRRIENSWIESKCKWTPFDGLLVHGWPCGVFLRGEPALWEEQIIGHPQGEGLVFHDPECLPDTTSDDL